MAMVGKMFWYSKLACWYCKIDGRKQRLSPCETDARLLYEQHLAQHGKTTEATVRSVVAIYLGRKKVQANTLEKKRSILVTLVNDYGDMMAEDLDATHIASWLEKNYSACNPTSIHDRIAEVQAAWRFALRNSLIKKSNVHAVEKPMPQQREHFVPRKDWDRYLDACRNPQLRLILEFGFFTGCRAQEAVVLTCADWAGDRFTLPRARAKGRRHGRLIMVPKRLQPTIETVVAEVGDGHVFRNTRGKPWNKHSLNCAMRQLKKRLKDPELCFTSLRHSFATAQVAAGVPLEIVSKLLGHSSTKMVYSRYARYAKTDVLGDAIEAL